MEFSPLKMNKISTRSLWSLLWVKLLISLQRQSFHKQLATDLFLISMAMLMTIQKTNTDGDACKYQGGTGPSTLLYLTAHWKVIWKQILNSSVNLSVLCFYLVKSSCRPSLFAISSDTPQEKNRIQNSFHMKLLFFSTPIWLYIPLHQITSTWHICRWTTPWYKNIDHPDHANHQAPFQLFRHRYFGNYRDCLLKSAIMSKQLTTLSLIIIEN